MQKRNNLPRKINNKFKTKTASMNADGSDITTEQEHKQSPDDFPPVNSHKIQNTLYSKHDSYQKLRN